MQVVLTIGSVSNDFVRSPNDNEALGFCLRSGCLRKTQLWKRRINLMKKEVEVEKLMESRSDIPVIICTGRSSLVRDGMFNSQFPFFFIAFNYFF
jgi:gamma-glutamyl phosphate reductase